MSHEIANGYSTRPGLRLGIVYNEAEFERTCPECGAVERTKSRTWKRCRACAKKRDHVSSKQRAARRKAVGG